MLDSSARQIAIQAIASRAQGTPTDAAKEIVKGIAALDFPDKPFVIWPYDLPLKDRLEALEAEAARVRRSIKSTGEWTNRLSSCQPGSAQYPECEDIQSHYSASRAPGQANEAQLAPHEEAKEAGLHQEQKPDPGASDASQ